CARVGEDTGGAEDLDFW
nr:immunoglobulin heavy chain junction region [Macaca mulatta]MOX65739.1 immunoglobulin heavy chain junction region [Macaca mulatta]